MHHFLILGWHRRFNGKAKGSKLHFYRLVPALPKETNTVSIQVRLVEEQTLARYQRTTYKTSQGNCLHSGSSMKPIPFALQTS